MLLFLEYTTSIYIIILYHYFISLYLPLKRLSMRWLFKICCVLVGIVTFFFNTFTQSGLSLEQFIETQKYKNHEQTDDLHATMMSISD